MISDFFMLVDGGRSSARARSSWNKPSEGAGAVPPGVMKTLKGQVKSSQVKSSFLTFSSTQCLHSGLLTLCRPECKQSLSESFDIAVIDDIAVIYRPTDAEAQNGAVWINSQLVWIVDASTTCSTSLGSV